MYWRNAARRDDCCGEATVVREWIEVDLADLEKCCTALGKVDAHKKWSKDMEPYVVSGSARWRSIEPCDLVSARHCRGGPGPHYDWRLIVT